VLSDAWEFLALKTSNETMKKYSIASDKKSGCIDPKISPNKELTYIHSAHAKTFDLVSATQVKHGQGNHSSAFVTVRSLATHVASGVFTGSNHQYINFLHF
jgi:hypothetical protein